MTWLNDVSELTEEGQNKRNQRDLRTFRNKATGTFRLTQVS